MIAGEGHAPIHVWARDPNDETLAQLRKIAAMPYVVSHVAAMADAHVASGVAVGTVFATEHALVPEALGGDLGCGMSAVRLGLDAVRLDRRTLERLVVALGRVVPAGRATHRGPGEAVPDALLEAPLSTRSLEHTRESLARRHLGTLGEGNHFLELDRDVDGETYLLVHTGSRGVGAAIAQHHGRAAGHALASLDAREDAGARYIEDHQYALEFARANRKRIVARAIEAIADVAGEVDPEPLLDVHHNFVARERWRGRELYVHRKGAMRLGEGETGLVPGSMATASYLVRGLAREEAFSSCSHGAGRVMSRRQARAHVSQRALEAAMQRIVFPAHLARDLVTEAPMAYRDVREVLEDQQDLVTREKRIVPIAVLKG